MKTILSVTNNRINHTEGSYPMDTNLAYQEERREELINGQVVMMAPASSRWHPQYFQTLPEGEAVHSVWRRPSGPPDG